MISALILSLVVSDTEFDFYSFGPYDNQIARPEVSLGYGPGERHTTFRKQELTLNNIVASSDRVKVFNYGESTEGRPLKILAFSSSSNINRLEEIRLAHQAITRGEDVQEDLPVIVWINESIHGNETASFESAMWLSYTLAASQNPEILKILDDAVIIVNPVFNPDGHERFVVWYNSISIDHDDPQAIEHAEQGFLSGRSNHYRFDLNRDRVSLSQKESQQAVAMYRRWNPQVYVDQHGQVGTFFFPPVAESINANVDRERYIKFSEILGRKTAASFDEQGWRYFVRQTFDLYYAGYLDSWASLNGAIGMTHETDGGRAIRRERSDGSVITLRDGVAKHLTSALAVISSSAENKKGLIDSFSKYQKDAVSGKHAGNMKRIVAMSDDRRALNRYSSLLTKQGIEWTEVGREYRQRAIAYSDGDSSRIVVKLGSIVVDLAQPRGHLAKALLEPGQDFEEEFTSRQLKIRDEMNEKENYPSRERPEFYDTTGWSLPLAFGLDAYWSSDTPEVEKLEVDGVQVHRGGKVGWAIPYSDQDDAVAVFRLLQSGVRVHQATKEMEVDGKNILPGTFFIFRDRNEGLNDKDVNDVLRDLNCRSYSLDTSFPDSGVVGPGSGSVRPMTKPKIAIVFGDQPRTTRFGSIWHLMDNEFDLPFTPISQRALSGDLSEYTAIIMPSGASVTDGLKQWVSGGGSLVVLGGSSVMGKDGMVDLDQSKLDDDKNPTSLPGALFEAKLNSRSPLAYGYDASKSIAVPVSGSRFYKAKESGGGVVLLGEKPNAISGWTWPDETEKALSGTVWLHDEPVGGGHVIWFSQDPTSRALWPGTYKMLLNAMLLGR